MSPRVDHRSLHPLHAMLIGFTMAFFAGGLAADVAFLNTAEMQWSNFAAWLIAGALLFGAPVLLWALVAFIRTRPREWLYLLIVAAMWIAGLVNAFRHSADGWASVGASGLALSILCTLLALAAGWIGYSGRAS